ncbi:MAG: hypothetical protein ACLR0U_09735 [Enterocloster clostridioformis]
MWCGEQFFLEGDYAASCGFLENAYENLNAIAGDKEFRGQNITEEELPEPVLKRWRADRGASRLLRLMNENKYNTTIVIQDSGTTGELIPLAKDGKFSADAHPPLYTLGIIGPRT